MSRQTRLAAVLFLGLVVAICGVQAAPATKKLKSLRAKVGDYKGDSLPLLVSSNYTRFSVTGPRDYQLLVLFTVRDPKFQCQSCPTTEAEMVVAARSYAAAVPVEKRTLFFVAVEYETGGDAYALHQFRNAPNVVFRPTSTIKGTPAGQVVSEPHHLLAVALQDTGDTPSAAKLLELAGVGHVPVVRDPKERATVSLVLAIGVGVIASIAAHCPSALLFPARKQFYVLLSLLVYGVSISGVIYCIIRAPPAYGHDRRTGKATVFDTSGNGQFLLEGVLNGCLNLLAGGAVILAVRTAKSKPQSNAVIVGVTLACIGAFIAIYMQIVSLYATKTPWYSVERLVPPGLSTRTMTRWWSSTLKTASSSYDSLVDAYSSH